MDLGFTIESICGAPIKIRDDGRRGPCVADEAKLWQALCEAQAEAASLRERLASLVPAPTKERKAK